MFLFYVFLVYLPLLLVAFCNFVCQIGCNWMIFQGNGTISFSLSEIVQYTGSSPTLQFGNLGIFFGEMGLFLKKNATIYKNEFIDGCTTMSNSSWNRKYLIWVGSRNFLVDWIFDHNLRYTQPVLWFVKRGRWKQELKNQKMRMKLILVVFSSFYMKVVE